MRHYDTSPVFGRCLVFLVRMSSEMFQEHCTWIHRSLRWPYAIYIRLSNLKRLVGGTRTLWRL